MLIIVDEYLSGLLTVVKKTLNTMIWVPFFCCIGCGFCVYDGGQPLHLLQVKRSRNDIFSHFSECASTQMPAVWGVPTTNTNAADTNVQWDGLHIIAG